MSAIGGIYNLDARSVDFADLQRMGEILAHRGPDGQGVWSNSSAGLMHRMLWTTPESLQEKLPLVKQSGDLVITADARIDNHDELFTSLGLSGRPKGEVADSELILAAYEKWGEHCPEKLLGDFAFAIWDGRKRTLFCARDHFGVKPFYYYSSGRTFIFASEIKALLCLSEVPRQLDEQRVSSYLASITDDVTNTFYKDILRLSPAHSLTVSRQGTRLQNYWSLDPSFKIQLSSDAEYTEAFRELFTEAVRCRLRSAYPIASKLSGGLDSSFITCVARKLNRNNKDPWPTFSCIYNEMAECDERPYINAVLAQENIESHFFDSDRLNPLTDLDHLLWHQDEPHIAPHLFVSWGLYGFANKKNFRILLDGHDGDTTVSHGFGYLHELARVKRWLSLATEIRGFARIHNDSPWELFGLFAWKYGLNPIVSRSPGLKMMHRYGRALVRRIRGKDNRTSGWSVLLNPEFIQRTDLSERYRAWQQILADSAQTEREQHYRSITQSLQPLALEILDKTAAAFSIENRYPFWDKRLVQFCLALPPDQKLHRGWSRLVMRRAMTDIVPAEIQWRRDKCNFFPHFVHGLLNFERENLDKLCLGDLGTLEEYVDVAAFREAYRQSISPGFQKNPRSVFAIWRVINLVFWLKKHSMNSYNQPGIGGDARIQCANIY